MDTKVSMAITKHFFKVMTPGFHSKLTLPPAFCRDHLLGENLTAAIISSCVGVWYVKVGKCCKGYVYFKEGWDRFVQDHGLNLGDFVVFEHKGSMRFHAFVFDHSTCEKKFPLKVETEEMKASIQLASHEHVNHITRRSQLNGDACHRPGTSSFVSTITASNGFSGFSYMNIPAEFARANGLQAETSMILRVRSGKSWPVKLSSRKNSASTLKRTSITKGWDEFYASNKLKEGDVCHFELRPRATRSNTTIVLDVRVFPRPT